MLFSMDDRDLLGVLFGHFADDAAGQAQCFDFGKQSGCFFDRDAHQQAAGCLRIEKDFLQGIVIDLEVHIGFQVITVALSAGCDQEFLGSLIGLRSGKAHCRRRLLRNSGR